MEKICINFFVNSSIEGERKRRKNHKTGSQKCRQKVNKINQDFVSVKNANKCHLWKEKFKQRFNGGILNQIVGFLCLIKSTQNSI